MLPRQVVSHAQLVKEGLAPAEIANLSAALKIFPTPFKGIYYVPSEEERAGWFMDDPIRVLTLAIALFLSSGKFYYSCATAEEAVGISWRPSGEIHIVNEKVSLKRDIGGRIARNLGKGTFRSGKIGRLLSFYGRKIVFHKVGSIGDAKIRRTPRGSFALRSQIRADRKRFRE
ncbi:MAG: hypothetical protein Q7T16_02780 [Candidatus Burarchaeum sp.]|nr:hypothetical protein [Candidatus Burarchaeum sp.]MDO8339559.1 hypothetical protein [Candidatus Burarchaeum sp.]